MARRTLAAAATCAAAVLVAYVALRAGSSPGAAPPRAAEPAPRARAPAGAPGGGERSPALPSPPASPPRSGTAVRPAAPEPADRWVDPATLSPEELEARRRFRLEQVRRGRAMYEQHPPFSRPLRENEDLLVPEQVPPTVRPLGAPSAAGRAGAVVVRQTQDRLFLRPGMAATVGLEAGAGGEPVPVRVTSAALVRSAGTPPALSDPVLRVEFTSSGDVRVATFAPPAEALGSYTGDLLLRVEAEAGGERGTLVYAFVYTGAPPAAFSGDVRDRLQGGSVVFEAGVDVWRAGRYRITARVDDAAGRPLALARFDGELEAGALEVPLVLFGKIALDEGARSPFVLRDVEGFRLLDGVYPDRETMATWAGPHRSRPYRADELSAAAWTGGEAPRPTRRAR